MGASFSIYLDLYISSSGALSSSGAISIPGTTPLKRQRCVRLGALVGRWLEGDVGHVPTGRSRSDGAKLRARTSAGDLRQRLEDLPEIGP